VSPDHAGDDCRVARLMLRTRPQPSPRHAAALAAPRGPRRARAPPQVRPLFGKSGADEKKYGAIRILAEEVTNSADPLPSPLPPVPTGRTSLPSPYQPDAHLSPNPHKPDTRCEPSRRPHVTPPGTRRSPPWRGRWYACSSRARRSSPRTGSARCGRTQDSFFLRGHV
jgi:hypothetical protein